MVWKFRCKKCGSRNLRVESHWTEIQHCKDILSCNCGNPSDKGIAAEKVYDITRHGGEYGYLDDEHHVEEWNNLEGSEQLDEPEIEENEFNVYCDECCKSAKDENWETKEEKTEIVNDQIYVYCDNCNREIEFGWSHPGRGGRIWPAECSDFNPLKSWPEPRYRKKWATRSWLRPSK